MEGYDALARALLGLVLVAALPLPGRRRLAGLALHFGLVSVGLGLWLAALALAREEWWPLALAAVLAASGVLYPLWLRRQAGPRWLAEAPPAAGTPATLVIAAAAIFAIAFSLGRALTREQHLQTGDGLSVALAIFAAGALALATRRDPFAQLVALLTVAAGLVSLSVALSPGVSYLSPLFYAAALVALGALFYRRLAEEREAAHG